jgi:hypothetical protein
LSTEAFQELLSVLSVLFLNWGLLIVVSIWLLRRSSELDRLLKRREGETR